MNLKRGIHLVLAGLFGFLVTQSCKKVPDSEAGEEEIVVQVPVPSFSADSAYHFIEKQVSFGPRVPGTSSHKKTEEWLKNKFTAYGYEVTLQNFTALLYDGKTVPGTNIIASFKPDASKRILLAAHWDTRAMSDRDDNVKNKAIDGANDGASGVGVLLEIARNLVEDSTTVGVDFILFDVEDWGAPSDFVGPVNHPYGGYCLGSEYWSKNLHKEGYHAYYGILLDMVGAEGAQFMHEDLSLRVAPTIVSTVWSTASQLGYGQYFLNRKGGSIVDDHVPVNLNAKIPMIDIIDYRLNDDFFPHHHTINDNMGNINKGTLKAVGQSVMHVLYQEK